MELSLRVQKFKSTFSLRPAQLASLLLAATALSACNTSKMVGDLNPRDTLHQGYVVDQQSLDLVPVGSSFGWSARFCEMTTRA